ncbi:ribosomal protein S18-alanine N-acetyltransferase [Streptomyces sp. ST2-7A]|uniref:ribosomal protein S18-alanine N-acetyltransferase n=1 Tax=Streptomyces sp. ST2-7A TaxID=2907214 RepID=UPI001F40DFA9|nr:ribosomal protein S18-alanine N-acetyltransferase [Streptomyces sp. ST2-7A]MCE7078762.1 ribosomal protein S18-alanine N-acetyltransferase [Streptomyces sp. ST2-7A]
MRWWDIEPVRVLEHELFPEDAWTVAMFWSELAGCGGPAPLRRYTVAEAPDGSIAGWTGLAFAGGSADVQTIAVAPHRQAAGLGTVLLRDLLTAAADLDCREVFLEVRTDNDRARRLYERHGFEPMGVRRGYYQPGGHDALVMRRDHTRPLPPAPRPRAPGVDGTPDTPASADRPTPPAPTDREA